MNNPNDQSLILVTGSFVKHFAEVQTSNLVSKMVRKGAI